MGGYVRGEVGGLAIHIRQPGMSQKKFRAPQFGSVWLYMDVSENRGTPKSSIVIGFSIINHPFWGLPIFGNTHICLTILVGEASAPERTGVFVAPIKHPSASGWFWSGLNRYINKQGIWSTRVGSEDSRYI